MTHPAYEDCRTCFEYGKQRMGVLVPAMHEKRQETGESAARSIWHAIRRHRIAVTQSVEVPLPVYVCSCGAGWGIA